jgi:hypothetical protein
MDYRREQWGSKTVYIVEEHHHVLIPWAEQDAPPHVLTLDHHTDVLASGQHFAEPAEAARRLRHDEHIDYALRHGIIRSSVIFSTVNHARDYHPGIQIVNFHNHPEYPTAETRDLLADYYGNALESHFLRQCLDQCTLHTPYILDIDLDYFKTERSIHPADGAVFAELVRNSLCLTVSREADWVRLLNRDWEQIDADYLESNLAELVARAAPER